MRVPVDADPEHGIDPGVCSGTNHSPVMVALIVVSFAVSTLSIIRGPLSRFVISYIPGGTTGLSLMVRLASSLCTRTMSQAIEA